MGKLTGTQHGDSANRLLAFYQAKALELEDSGQYFMAAVALAFAMESAILTYLLVEFGEDNGGELQVPDSASLTDLIAASEGAGVLSAPIDTPSHIARSPDVFPKHVAKDAAQTLRRFRNLIHPGRALKEGFDPTSFTRKQLETYKEMYESVLHSLMYYL